MNEASASAFLSSADPRSKSFGVACVAASCAGRISVCCAGPRRSIDEARWDAPNAWEDPRKNATDTMVRRHLLPASKAPSLSKFIPSTYRLRLIAQTLLVAVFFHPLPAFVLCDLGFSSLFE